MGEPSRWKTIFAALHQSGLYESHSSVEGTYDSPLGVWQRVLKDSRTVWNKFIWSDETKIELFGLKTKFHVSRQPGPIPTVKHGGGSIMLSECFSPAGTGRLVRIERKMNRVKYRSLMKTCSRALRTSDWGKGSPSNRTTTLSTQPRQHRSGKSLNVLEWPTPGLDWRPIWHLWRDLKIALQRRSPSNMI